jgi:hypothetical protein
MTRRQRLIFLLLLASGLLAGCVTHITPPPKPQEPALVFVLDHGRHTSLVVSTPDGALVRYAYGDWRYYAERLTGPGHAIAALLWSTEGALGRRDLPGPATASVVRSQVPLVIVSLYEIEVERARIEALRAQLDAIFAAAEQPRDTPETHLFFVPHPRAYTLRHNSNTAIAGWLEQLGCEIRGPAILANWRIHETATGEAK